MTRSRLAALAAGLLAAGTVTFAAASAFATSPAALLPGCNQAPPPPLYTAECLPAVSGPVPGAVTVTLPGVGTLEFTVKADGTIDPAVVPVATPTGVNFTASTPEVSSDGTQISVTFTNAADPVQKYVVRAKVSQTNPPAVGAPPGFIVTAKAAPAGEHENEQGDNDQGDNEQGDHEDGGKAPALQPVAAPHDDHESSSGGDHEQSDGQDGNSQGGGGD
jgi:hypothetical protein